MGNVAAFVLGLGLAFSANGALAMTGAPVEAPRTLAPRTLAPDVTRVEYFCSEGFVPTYGGRCVATPARDEIELFVETPVEPPVYRHRRRHGLQERY